MSERQDACPNGATDGKRRRVEDVALSRRGAGSAQGAFALLWRSSHAPVQHPLSPRPSPCRRPSRAREPKRRRLAQHDQGAVWTQPFPGAAREGSLSR